MDIRYAATLLTVIVLALAAGVVGAQSQSQQASPKAIQAAPTSVLSPQQSIVEIIARPPAGQIPATCNVSPNESSESIVCPQTITVVADVTVTWANLDIVNHSITADDGSFDSGVLSSQEGKPLAQISANQIFRHVFHKPGRYPYSDFLHPEMHGVVIVRP